MCKTIPEWFCDFTFFSLHHRRRMSRDTFRAKKSRNSSLLNDAQHKIDGQMLSSIFFVILLTLKLKQWNYLFAYWASTFLDSYHRPKQVFCASLHIPPTRCVKLFRRMLTNKKKKNTCWKDRNGRRMVAHDEHKSRFLDCEFSGVFWVDHNHKRWFISWMFGDSRNSQIDNWLSVNIGRAE